jgi:hypothetical protein
MQGNVGSGRRGHDAFDTVCFLSIWLPHYKTLYSGLSVSGIDRLCGLVVRVSEVPGSIPGATRFSEKHWVWNGVYSALVRINEELTN